MFFHLERVTQPDIEVITLDEMRRNLRLFEDLRDDDDDIEDLITAAREWAEEYSGHAFIEQQWRITLAGTFGMLGVGGNAVSGYTGAAATSSGSVVWNGGGIALRRTPVLGLVSIDSIGSDGTLTSVDVDGYQVRGANSKFPEIIALDTVDVGTGALAIVFRAGYADRLGSPQQGAEMVPKRFKQAMKLWAEAHYDKDPDYLDTLVKAARDLLQPLRAIVPFA